MKKHILLLASIILLGYSCNEEYDYSENIDKSPKVKLNITTNEVAKNLPLLTSIDKWFISGNTRVDLLTLIYDSNGNLVTSENNCLKNLMTEVCVTPKLEKGKYKIVNVSINYFYDTKDESVTYYSWKVSGIEKYSTLEVKDRSFYGSGQIVGYDERDIEVTDKGCSELIYLQSQQASIITSFANPKCAPSDIEYFNFGLLGYSNTIKWDNNSWFFPEDKEKDFVDGYIQIPSQQTYLYRYYTYCVNPGNLTYRLFQKKFGEEYTQVGEYPVTIEPGKEYHFVYDFATNTFGPAPVPSSYDIILTEDEGVEEELIMSVKNRPFTIK